MISLLQVQAICNSKRPEIEEVYPHLTLQMGAESIDTPQREAMFLAQAIHETGGFRWLTELASGADYEGRLDLGNTEPGDGQKFKGRGIFQTTGRRNYARTSKAIFGSERTLLDHPGLLASPNYAARSATYYWTWKDLNRLADADDFEGVTRKINGGLNGIVERRALLARAKLALSY